MLEENLETAKKEELKRLNNKHRILGYFFLASLGGIIVSTYLSIPSLISIAGSYASTNEKSESIKQYLKAKETSRQLEQLEVTSADNNIKFLANSRYLRRSIADYIDNIEMVQLEEIRAYQERKEKAKEAEVNMKKSTGIFLLSTFVGLVSLIKGVRYYGKAKDLEEELGIE